MSVTVREVLSGNVGPVLISLREAGNRFVASAVARGYDVNAPPAVNAVALLSIAHLSHLLVIGAEMKELAQKLSTGTSNLIRSRDNPRSSSLGADFECGDVSFVEKLYLEAAQSLNSLEYVPIQV